MASGGKRAGLGRKPCLDKKQTVVLYFKTKNYEKDKNKLQKIPIVP